MGKFILSLFFVLFCAYPAFGVSEEATIVQSSDNCLDYAFKTCNNDDMCTNAASNTLFIANGSRYSAVTIVENFINSSATAYTCEIRFNHDASGPSASNYSVLKDYATSASLVITEATASLIYSANLQQWWIYCTSVTTQPAAFNIRVCKE